MLGMIKGTSSLVVYPPIQRVNTVTEGIPPIIEPFDLNGTHYYVVQIKKEQRSEKYIDRYIREPKDKKTIEWRLANAWIESQIEASIEHTKPKKELLDPTHFNPDNKAYCAGNQKICNYQVGFCSFQGRKNKMEDEFLITSLDINIQGDKINIPLFGIFDGHAGNEVALYLKEHLPRIFKKTIEKLCVNGLTKDNIWNALKIVFVEANNEYKKTTITNPIAGSTAIITIILQGELWTANLGDCRAILESGHQLSKDARAGDATFKKGILKRGGQLEEWKDTSGQISYRISALSDTQNPPRALEPARAVNNFVEGVCKRSKVTCCNLPTKGHLIMGCDGIFERFSTRCLSEAMRCYKKPPAKAVGVEQLAKAVVATSYMEPNPAGDNLTCIIVDLERINT